MAQRLDPSVAKQQQEDLRWISSSTTLERVHAVLAQQISGRGPTPHEETAETLEVILDAYPHEADAIDRWEWQADLEKAIAALNQDVPTALIRRIMTHYRNIDDESAADDALAALCRGLSIDRARLLFERLKDRNPAGFPHSIWDDVSTSAAHVAVRLGGNDLRAHIECMIKLVKDGYHDPDKAIALATLADALNGSKARDLWDLFHEVLETMIEDGFDLLILEVLCQTASRLPKRLHKPVLAIIERVGSEENRALGLCRIAPYLSGAAVRGALSIAESIADPDRRAVATSSLLPQLPERGREIRMRSLIGKLESCAYLETEVVVLANLYPHLRESNEALWRRWQSCMQFKLSASYAFPTLFLLGARCKPNDAIKVWREAFFDAFNSASPLQIASVHSMVPDMLDHTLVTQITIFLTALDALTHVDRSDGLKLIEALAPLIDSVGGTDLTGAVCNAIEEVRAWWH